MNLLNTAVAVTIVFVVLKLADVIDWSWWWVFSPLILTVSLVVLATLVVAATIIAIEDKK